MTPTTPMEHTKASHIMALVYEGMLGVAASVNWRVGQREIL